MKSLPLWLRPRDLATHWGLSERTIQRYVRQNGLPDAEVISDTVYLNGLASGASIPIKAVAKSLACVLWSKLVDQKITV